MKDVSNEYLAVAEGIILGMDKDKANEVRKHLSASEYFNEWASITIQGHRGSGHTHFAKKLDVSLSMHGYKCIILVSTRHLQQDMIRHGAENVDFIGVRWHNQMRENKINNIIVSKPSIIIADSIHLSDEDIVRFTHYIYSADEPIFFVKTGR